MLLAWPFYFMHYFVVAIGYLIYYGTMSLFYIGALIFNLIMILISIVTKKSFKVVDIKFANDNLSKNTSRNVYKTKSKRSAFSKEADLYGLSLEDRKRAKEERMSPAEYIEAEEYDDDELLKDDWER